VTRRCLRPVSRSHSSQRVRCAPPNNNVPDRPPRCTTPGAPATAFAADSTTAHRARLASGRWEQTATLDTLSAARPAVTAELSHRAHRLLVGEGWWRETEEPDLHTPCHRGEEAVGERCWVVHCATSRMTTRAASPRLARVSRTRSWRQTFDGPAKRQGGRGQGQRATWARCRRGASAGVKSHHAQRPATRPKAESTTGASKAVQRQPAASCKMRRGAAARHVQGAAWRAEEGTRHVASRESESETSDPRRCRENRSAGGVCREMPGFDRGTEDVESRDGGPLRRCDEARSAA
jgi:hypothetical protein